MTTAQRLDQLERVTSILMERLEWVTVELLDQLPIERFEELQRQEILSLFSVAHGDDEAEAKSARTTLERFRLACPDTLPNDLSDACR